MSHCVYSNSNILYTCSLYEMLLLNVNMYKWEWVFDIFAERVTNLYIWKGGKVLYSPLLYELFKVLSSKMNRAKIRFFRYWSSLKSEARRFSGKSVRPHRREIIYCKREILSLSSSKILTPHPPLRLASVSSPPTKAGGTHSPGGEGMGGQYFGRREK
jgi:hypothetical protein